MKLPFIRRESTFHLRKRVFRRFRSVESREFVWLSLHTDSEMQAAARAPQVWQEMLEGWEALLAGASADAEMAFAAAKNIAGRRSFRFMGASEVAKLPTTEILARVEASVRLDGTTDKIVAATLLGTAKEPQLSVTKALEAYWPISADTITGKSEVINQIGPWRSMREVEWETLK